MAKRKLLDGVKQQGDGTTSDGTTALVLTSLDLSSTSWAPDGLSTGDCVVTCACRIMGWESSAVVGMTWRAFQSFVVQTGVVSTFGSPTVSYDIRSSNFSSANPNFTVTGSTIKMQIIGVTEHTMTWLGAWEVSLWQPS